MIQSNDMLLITLAALQCQRAESIFMIGCTSHTENVAPAEIGKWGTLAAEKVLAAKPDAIIITGRETELKKNQWLNLKLFFLSLFGQRPRRELEGTKS